MKIKFFFPFFLVLMSASCMVSNKTGTSNKLKDADQTFSPSAIPDEKQKFLTPQNPILVFSSIVLSVYLINLLLMQISKSRKKTKSQ